MNTTVSHLGAGICQTVFMNFICHLRQQAIAQAEVGDCACAYSGGWVASGGEVGEAETQSGMLLSAGKLPGVT